MTTTTGKLAGLLTEVEGLLSRAATTDEAIGSVVLTRGIERARVVLDGLRWELVGYPVEADVREDV